MAVFPTNLIPQLVEFVYAERTVAARRQTLLSGLTVCQSWYPYFKRVLWRTIDLSDLSNLSGPALEARISRFQQALSLDPANGELVKVLRVAGWAEIPLISACPSVNKLYIHEVAMPLDPIRDLNPLYALTQLACDGIPANALSFLLLNAPSLKHVHGENMDVADASDWRDFRYRSIPPISVFSVHARLGICQGFFDSVLVPLAGTLATLHLSSMYSYRHPESELNLAGYGRANLVFPQLSDLRCFRMDPVGALALTTMAPNIRHFFVSWCLRDWELAGQLAERCRELRESMTALEWVFVGDANEIAGTLTRGWMDPDWLPKLMELPNVGLRRNTVRTVIPGAASEGTYMRALIRGFKVLEVDHDLTFTKTP